MRKISDPVLRQSVSSFSRITLSEYENMPPDTSASPKPFQGLNYDHDAPEQAQPSEIPRPQSFETFQKYSSTIPSYSAPTPAPNPTLPTVDDHPLSSGLNYGQAYARAQASKIRLPHPFDSYQANPSTTPRHDLPMPAPATGIGLGSGITTVDNHPSTQTEAQKVAIRQAWIRNNSAQIASLARSRAAAQAKYHSTQSLEDLENLQRITRAFADATDLDKRLEERRNLFMPEGMMAMRTGVGCVAGDGFGEVPQKDGDGSGMGEKGKLLGWRMATMEKIGAEVIKGTNERKERFDWMEKKRGKGQNEQKEQKEQERQEE
ncbi:hypothetical protein K505DRAFT_166497 [Melanomma pulvis-pyrius CBS 109.77]|uniref:Uncharacterized protein n=1 Tax=Melanomma pulvis-pyrius CBS 109.77 TaxID=1314802 RepID=A0A6A6XIA4_9PLEO|nr:hypothetical protein K505DRAFT_166497 [Melanomma pulvis-pyrius CBS 109.77]